MAVSHLDNYKSCLHCRARVEPADESSGRCSKADCRMLQNMEFCTSHVCAKLMVMVDATFISLSVYGKLLYNLANVEEECEIC